MIKWISTPAHLTIILLVLHTFLKGFQDALALHKNEKGGEKWFNVVIDTLLYCTAGKRAS